MPNLFHTAGEIRLNSTADLDCSTLDISKAFANKSSYQCASSFQKYIQKPQHTATSLGPVLGGVLGGLFILELIGGIIWKDRSKKLRESEMVAK